MADATVEQGACALTLRRADLIPDENQAPAKGKPDFQQAEPPAVTHYWLRLTGARAARSRASSFSKMPMMRATRL